MEWTNKFEGSWFALFRLKRYPIRYENKTIKQKRKTLCSEPEFIYPDSNKELLLTNITL